MNEIRRLHLIYGALAIWFLSYLTVSDSPSLYSPNSIIVGVPVLVSYANSGSNVGFALATLVVPVVFLVWSFPLLTGQEKIPLRTKILVGVFIALSGTYLFFSVPFAMGYYGAVHTVGMCFLNAASWVVLLLIILANTRRESYATNFFCHWFLFAWLAWGAFPYLMEAI